MEKVGFAWKDAGSWVHPGEQEQSEMQGMGGAYSLVTGGGVGEESEISTCGERWSLRCPP